MTRIELPSGAVCYYNEQNQYHREDGPAIEYPNGNKVWYLNGLCHRLDGPAVAYYNGDICYHIMGKPYSYKNWLAIKNYPLLW